MAPFFYRVFSAGSPGAFAQKSPGLLNCSRAKCIRLSLSASVLRHIEVQRHLEERPGRITCPGVKHSETHALMQFSAHEIQHPLLLLNSVF